MIDLHFHVLPGIDDGPETIAGSEALARAAVDVGVRTLVATPHVSWRYPNDPDSISRLVDQVAARLSGAGVSLELVGGAEIAMTYLPEIEPSALARLRLGRGDWLLVEPPFAPATGAVEEILLDLQRRGHQILLAHPERCPAFHHDPRMLGSLVRAGILTSITAGSLVGRFGRVPQRFALKLVREEMVHNVASDAHDLAARAPGIVAELDRAGLSPLTEWLTEAVPSAILTGQKIPGRPRVGRLGTASPRRWRLRR